VEVESEVEVEVESVVVGESVSVHKPLRQCVEVQRGAQSVRATLLERVPAVETAEAGEEAESVITPLMLPLLLLLLLLSV
jgi:hypothetical protein